MKHQKSSNQNKSGSPKNKNILELDYADKKTFIEEKSQYILEIIRNTLISIKKNKIYEIFSNNDDHLSITMLSELYEKTNDILKKVNENSISYDKMIEGLQKVIDKLSMIICGFGTLKFDDLLFISFGSEFKKIKIEDNILQDKYELLRKCVNPIGYKIIHWKPTRAIHIQESYCSNKLSDDIFLIDESNMFECYDVESNSKLFYQKINGIRIIIQNERAKKTLIINGILQELPIEFVKNKYTQLRMEELKCLINEASDNDSILLKRIVETVTLKDLLVYGNMDIYKRIFSVYTEVNIVRNSKLDITMKRFLETDLFQQRNIIMNLLVYNKESDIQYICYLLYDLISVNAHDNINTNEQIKLYDSLPSKMKSYFKDAINYTVKYTSDMSSKFDLQKVTLEQQIYLLKVNDSVKEKAISKLKEVKGKSDEPSTKAKQYLEGLIKIPFGICKEEPILKKVKSINQHFQKVIENINLVIPNSIIIKNKYTNSEIMQFIKRTKNLLREVIIKYINNNINSQKGKCLNAIISCINNYKKPKEERVINSKQQKGKKIECVLSFLKEANIDDSLFYDLYGIMTNILLSRTMNDIVNIETMIKTLRTNIEEIENILDESIHCHSNTKKELLKIISQWINGDQKGYCFGFEGSPGIGKTSLAKKGLSNCLKDENGVSRPFAFIALGGSSNGSILEGHGYTYLNSTWGKIVDILMETKCMNPIIYIDELDKVSKTENGKEIIGILTHLIDATQNDGFQDKYFTGIDIDLSKVLFIFSYNDPSQIDKVLLDRIHRIKFDNLTIKDKIEISNKYILPELNEKMGFENVVQIEDSVLESIIDNYTCEPGVRKLKEILFDIYGEINIELLRTIDEVLELPIILTHELVENKYLKNHHKIEEKKIHQHSEVGIINGLWANVMGRGGIIPIETTFYPCSSFLELRLTGLQGDVMKESMNVAKSLAWNMLTYEIKRKWLEIFDATKCQGLHIHCPEGAVSKDGPSAGTAITLAIYSLLNDVKIKNDIAITGEINLQGEVTAIGGLDLKIVGGLKAGVKTFIYPESNEKDFTDFKEKYTSIDLSGIQFYKVKHIKETIAYVFSEKYPSIV